MTRLKYFILGTLVVGSLAVAQGYMSQLNVGNIRLTGNTVSTQNTNGDLTFDLNGTGSVLFTDLTASRVLYLNGSKKLTSSAVTDTELGYLGSVTSSLCGVNQSCTLTGKTLTGNIADNLVHSSGGVFVHNSTGNITVPSGTDQLVGRATTDTLTNKTLTGNTAANLISGSGTLVLNTSGTITIPNGADTLVGRATTDTLTNKTLTSPTLTTPTTDIVLWDDAATPSNPGAGFYKLYFKNDGKLYKLNPAGTEAEVGSGSGGGSSGINILSLYNHNAELGATTFWSETGGGTLSTNSTAANVANGTYAFSYDASAAADYASPTAVTIPAGLFGANCLLQFYYKGFDANMSVAVTDGSVTLASQALTAQTNYTTVSLSFICPSSGTLDMRLLASADAAIGYFDEVHLGSALNLSYLSQAAFVGSAYFASTANCAFVYSSASLASSATDADCPGPTVEFSKIGDWQTTDSDLPKVPINNLPPGMYELVWTVQINQSSGSNVPSLGCSDGTTTTQAVGGPSAETAYGITVTCYFEYSTAGNRTFELLGAVSAGTATINNNSALRKTWMSVKRFPLSNQLAYKPDQSANSWSGYHDSTCSWARTNTAYGDPTADATCSLVERTNTNFGTVSTYTVTNPMPGIVFTPSKAQKYLVSAVIKNKIGSGSGGVQANIQMLGNGSITIGQSSQTNTGDYINTNTIQGIYSATSTGSVTISLQTKSASGTVTIGTTAEASIDWTIFAIDQQLPAPLLVNSVVNSSSGITGIQAAKLNCDAGSTIMSQHGSWVTSIGNVSAGACALVLTSGTFSATPYCTATPATTGGFSTGLELNVDATSATAVSVDCEDDASSACTAFDFILQCVGAK